MDQLEHYLESVRRGLDVRSEAERDEITAEMRDHILTLAERFEDDGVEAEAAIAQAVQQMGDSLLVASRVSEAHDGGSWLQAGIAVIPIALAMAIVLLESRLDLSTVILPPWAAKIIILVALYSYVSPRISGRRWRMTWFASVIGSGLYAVTVLPIRLAADNPESAHLGWPIITILGVMALLASALLIKRGRWPLALITLAPMGVAIATPLSFSSVPASFSMAGAIATLIYFEFLMLAVLYLLVIEVWNGDWTMAWCFNLALWQPAHKMLPDLAAYANELAGLAIVAATVVAYTALPRSRAFLVFLLGGLVDGGIFHFLIAYCFWYFCSRRFGKREDAKLPLDQPFGLQ